MERLAKLDRLVLDIVKADPVCRLLMTVPGVGPITSLAYRTAVDPQQPGGLPHPRHQRHRGRQPTRLPHLWQKRAELCADWLYLYTPEGLLRGRRGTDVFVDGHAEGELYVFLGWTLADSLAGRIPEAARWGVVGLSLALAITALPINRFGGYGDRPAFFDWPLAIAGAASNSWVTTGSTVTLLLRCALADLITQTSRAAMPPRRMVPYSG